jgi:riboflavin kinase/FMN adenylyltransferase
MELVRGLSAVRERHRGCVVTIGTFDGLHLGHRALVREAVDRAQRAARRALMLTFEPMPREYLNRADPPARLTSFRERWRLLERMGLDALLVLRFDESLRRLNGDDFTALLQERLRVAALVVGYDFRFGRDGAASAAQLQAAGARLGFEVTIVPPILLAGERVSSSAVRSALERGDFAAAAALLGRPYGMRGRVVRGEQLGRTLGYPTANLRLLRRRPPLAGIFAVRAHGVGPGPLPAVASLGTRPTVGGTTPLLETHVFDFSGDLYGREIEVEFVAKIRDELRFESLAALVERMHDDARRARRILAA